MREAESSARALSTTYTYSSGTCQCQLPSILSRVFSSKDSGRLQARPEYQTTTCDASRLGSARPRRHGRGDPSSRFLSPRPRKPNKWPNTYHAPRGAVVRHSWIPGDETKTRPSVLTAYCTVLGLRASLQPARSCRLPACLSFFLYSASASASTARPNATVTLAARTRQDERTPNTCSVVRPYVCLLLLRSRSSRATTTRRRLSASIRSDPCLCEL